MTEPDDKLSIGFPWQAFAQFISRVRGSSVAAPILTAALGVFGFWLSPLKDRVYYYLYPPKAIVDCEIICVRTPMMRGDTVIVKLHLVPGSDSLTAGEIKANVPDEFLTLEDGNALVDLDGTEKKMVITYKFDAIKAGRPHLQYVYRFAKGGSIQRDLDFVIIDRKDGFPTFSDLSGEWGLMWDKGIGVLKISQNGSHIGGSFTLTEADNKLVVDGDVTGFVNGYNMRLILVPNKSHSTDKTATKAMYANLLRVSGPHELSICGRLNSTKDEPFVGQVVDPTASTQEICKGSNLLARAETQIQ